MSAYNSLSPLECIAIKYKYIFAQENTIRPQRVNSIYNRVLSTIRELVKEY